MTDAVGLGVDPDQFTISRMPFTTKDEERDRINPRVTLQDAAALHREHTNTVGAVAESRSRDASVRYHDRRSTSPTRGVSRDYSASPPST